MNKHYNTFLGSVETCQNQYRSGNIYKYMKARKYVVNSVNFSLPEYRGFLQGPASLNVCKKALGSNI